MGKLKTITPVQNLLFITFLVLIYVRPYELVRFLIPLQLTRMFMIFVLIALLSKSFNRTLHKVPLMKNQSMRWYLGLQAFTLVSAVFSVWPSQTVSNFIGTNVRIMITFIVLSSLLYNRDQVRIFVKTVFVCMFLFSIRIFLAYKSGSYIFDGGTKRIVGVGTLGSMDPNDVALVLAMGLPLGLYYFYTKKGMAK
ncbi:MAG: hypothetical protein KC684_10715, partial [Candidatus Omnitrophica bacterium]|nr:hypothetical protein [Candidatus Omnitrophota bacterium]